MFLHRISICFKNNGLRIANKLSSRHIYWRKHKMKVRPAVQTFSDSVGNAIESAIEFQLKEFQGCEETVVFIRYMKNIFDLLNSSSYLGKSFKAPLRCTNLNEWKFFIADAISYLERLSLTKDDSSKYLLTCKLSQDHLQLFFGLIRQRGGWNNDPTCCQFKSAFKRLIVRNELKVGKSVNCSPQGLINMLHVSSTSVARSSQFLMNNEEDFHALSCLMAVNREDHDYYS
ncbi:hypothetical protein J437_LFUL008733 [Ladona fulva]|uniref:THAP domain-containing protein 9 n=1 Tax=Ladona fulva TaxID=123851 RepID=A0A8K0K5M8_LADFU|nr:hypothetical protein J437_LFUL008733 [Ladona fulva]